MSAKTPKEKWIKRVKRWVVAQRAKRKAKAKDKQAKARQTPKPPRVATMTLAELKALWSTSAGPAWTPRRKGWGSRRKLDWKTRAVLEYPAIAAYLKSKRKAEKFLAWCHRKGLAPSEGATLLDSRHAARELKRKAA